MSRPMTYALLGALALGAASLTSESASALTVSSLAPVASTMDVGSNVEQVYYRRGYYRRDFGFRRGYGYRRPYGYGYRRPGPIRRLLNHL